MKYLNETVIRDIVDVINDVEKAADSDTFALKKSKYTSSISKQSKNLIMTFPVLCTNTIDATTATMVSKAIERKCVTLLQLLFSASGVTYAANAQEFISNFHKNVDMKSLSVDDYMQLADQINNDIDYAISALESAHIDSVIKEDMNLLKRETSFEDSINESSLQDFKIFNRNGNTMIIKEEIDRNLPLLYRARKDEVDARRIQADFFTKQLLDSDAKKCNELVPSLLVINYVASTPDKGSGTIPLISSAIVGVKARLIPVDSFEIIEQIFTKAKDKKVLLKFIKATTREISFVKDFVFAIDKAKIDALANSKKGSRNRMWKCLETRASKSRLKKALRATNDATAITTLVMTQEEVNYLKKTYSINMESISTAASILEAYNLLAFVIVDESIEVVKFLFDGEDSFETLSFNSLERESSDGMYKKVVTLMSKINR